MNPLEQLARRIEKVASTETRAKIAQAMSEYSLAQIDRCFATETDPYGNTWKAHKSPKATNPILQESGALRHSFTARGFSPEGFTVTSSVPYAAVHQYGSPERNIPARPFIPLANKGFGIWAKGYRKIASDILKEAAK